MTGLTLKLGYGSYPASGPRQFDVFAVVLTLLANMPLAFRRCAPMTVLVSCEVPLAVYEAWGYWLGLNQLGPQMALVTLASQRPRRWTVLGAAIIAPGMIYGNVHTWNGSTLDIIALSSMWMTALAVVGDGLRRLKEYGAIVADHAARLVTEQHEREQRAVLLERIRIARELHDIAAHHMSVVAVQAGLARYVLTSDPATAEKALLSIAAMSSEALGEVRRLVNILRPDPESDGGPAARDQDTPDVARLPVMIERVGLTGLTVEYNVSGEAQPLPAGVGLCVYRVVQESLTNAIKHAAGSRVTVSLRYVTDKITVRISNDGRRSAPPTGETGQLGSGGKGLVGMYERAILYGGTLTAGELPDGGFQVVLTLPIRSVAAASVENSARGDLRADR
ncbi:sensor histidine kinase [Micromonospora sp. 4G53]|uniref:histidine kinase n=1 Tax=Micromonospora sicca TaxID=2202420 RepID=A0ABU5JP53_9ACTN|nr:sensor histidine kinase [Micromonospora sp. 4G53]